MNGAVALIDAPGLIEAAIEIAASPRAVFDYCIDSRREMEWNPKLLAAAKLTDDPIAAGSRFDLRLAGVGWMRTEIVEFDRPSHWAATGVSRRLDVHFEAEVTHIHGGSRLVVRTVLLPHGPLRLALPVLRRVMSRHWQSNLRTIKAKLETA